MQLNPQIMLHNTLLIHSITKDLLHKKISAFRNARYKKIIKEAEEEKEE